MIKDGAALRKDTDQVTETTITIAKGLNAAMRTTKLTGSKARLYLGRWDGNQAVTFTLKRGGRAPRLAYAGVRSVNAKVFGDAPEAKDVAAPVDAPVTAAQMTFRVRAKYRFQITAGVVVSSISGADYELVENAKDENGEKSTKRFFVKTHDEEHRYFPSLNLVFYPWKRDLQPFVHRYPGEEAPSWLCGFGLVAGLNLKDPTRDLLLGVAYTFRNGIGINAGIDIGYEHKLPAGVELGVPITNAIVVEDHLTRGVYASLTVSSQILKDFVGVVFK